VVASLVRARQQKVRDPSLSLSRRHLVLVGVSEGEAHNYDPEKHRAVKSNNEKRVGFGFWFFIVGLTWGGLRVPLLVMHACVICVV
jgi:hypothetical protein